MASWPRPLEPVTGPFPPARLRGAADGMGDHGAGARALQAAGLVQPDLVTGMTLWLLARQPRDPAAEGATGKRASPIAGGVWVREQFTIHAPLAANDVFTVTGSSTGRYVRKGRRYSTTCSTTHDSSGRLIATNVSTGLMAYTADPQLADQVEGLPLADTPHPQPDHTAARDNPHLHALASATTGARLGGEAVEISLDMMVARDTSNADNPIHSDPEQARRAGLARPIAGGSHVLAFVLEPLMAAFGPQALLHGACFDVRWKAPTECDTLIRPTARVAAVHADRVEVELEVRREADDAVAMVGNLVIPMLR